MLMQNNKKNTISQKIRKIKVSSRKTKGKGKVKSSHFMPQGGNAFIRYT